MAAPRVSSRKIGQRNILDVELDGPPVRFPPYCTCCLAKPHPRRTLRFRNVDKTHTFAAPACGRCFLHAAVTDVMVGIVAALMIFGVLAAAYWLGTAGVKGDVSVGWRIFGGIMLLVTTVLSPLRALLAFAVILFSFIVLFFTLVGTTSLIFRGRNCSDLTARPDLKKIPTGLVFGFENREYGRRFAELNGGAASSKTPGPL